MTDGGHAGTSLERARRRLREVVAVSDTTETIPLAAADGRVLASAVSARSNVPHYPRAAMDGYAIRSVDTDDASGKGPVVLDSTSGDVGVGEAVRVHTGSPIPMDADAVVRLERTERRDGAIAVSRTIPEGKDVAPVGEDVRDGQRLYDPGHRLRPSDLGLLKSAGVREVSVFERPTVSVLPTGEEVVDGDPDPGEVVDTNGLTVSRYVDRWDGEPRYEDVVTDDEAALETAIREACDADFVATIGGSSVGDRDVVPDVIDRIGDLLVHGVSIKPGHPVGIGVVDETPIILHPGYPVSSIIAAVQFLRPALNWRAGTRPKPLPSVRATLAEPIESEWGIRRYARVRLHGGPADPNAGESATRTLWTNPRTAERSATAGEPPAELLATPTTHSGAGVLSSVALADGWVEVPEEVADLPSGAEVRVQDWEWHP